MALTKIERVQELARLSGIVVAEDELAEVADRLESLLSAMDDLDSLDLSELQPLTVFPDESQHGA